ncbi:MAG TPA: hypothetical protein VFR34_08280 [Paracoccaceae bacterium]|nr:hypothetical protein [Paracoccaceae bacterium]
MRPPASGTGPAPVPVAPSAVETARARAERRRATMPALVFVVLSLMVSTLLGAVIAFGATISPQAWDLLSILGPQVFTLWLASGYYYTGTLHVPAVKS